MDEQKNLRSFCESINCAVWAGIMELENLHPERRAVLRTFCSEDCFAYRFNRWISTVNKRIIDKKGDERYRT